MMMIFENSVLEERVIEKFLLEVVYDQNDNIHILLIVFISFKLFNDKCRFGIDRLNRI